MTRGVGRAVSTGLLGALAAVAWLALFYGQHPALVVDFDTAPPRLLTGVYPNEREPDQAAPSPGRASRSCSGCRGWIAASMAADAAGARCAGAARRESRAGVLRRRCSARHAQDGDRLRGRRPW